SFCSISRTTTTTSRTLTLTTITSVSFLTFFFLSIRPPPRSPLFPYTTLFRSSIVTGDLLEPVEEEEERRALLEGVTGFGGIEERDRKSTRLNSSHEWISYAVFCLKKKK